MKKVIILTSFIAFFSAAAFSQVIKGTYAIKNVETGMLLRIKDANKKDGTPLVAYEPVSWKCMTWDFKHVDGQTYQLKNLFTGKTFGAKDVTDGSSLEQQPFSIATKSQEYEFIPANEKAYLIKLKGSELYLTPSDKNGTTNSNIILSKKNNSKLQHWTIYEQHPDF